MDRHCLARMSLVLGLALIGAQPASAGVKESVDAVVRESYLKNVEVGVKLVKLGATADADEVLYERHADLPLTPASNLKLVTTSAALDTLGADFIFRTLLVQKNNTLALIGDGDPTLGDAELLRKVDWKSTTLFEKWAEALKARGLTKADQLLYDDSIFDQKFQHPNWPGDQIHKRYVAGVAGLNFNANCLDFYPKTQGAGEVVDYTIDPPTVDIPIENTCVQGSRNAVWLSRAADSDEIILRGQTPASNIEPISVTVNHPPRFAADAFAGAFAAAGIEIAGKPKRDATIRASASEWSVLAVHETPIKQVLARANKDSMNVYAEALCKRVGALASGEPGSWENGAAAIGKYLSSLGIPDNQFNLDDGSGLSRKNSVSPDLIITLLRHQFHGKNRDLYIGSLAVGGVDGTLENRFDDTPLKNRVHAKSGFIDGVSSLSGYAQSTRGEWYAFSIIFNGIGRGTNATAKKMQERIVLSIE